METYKIQLNLAAISEAEAALLRSQLQGLVEMLGYDKTKGLLANYPSILSNPLIKMKLNSYVKK